MGYDILIKSRKQKRLLKLNLPANQVIKTMNKLMRNNRNIISAEAVFRIRKLSLR